MSELRKRAIRLLAQREHARAELVRKLAAHGTQEEIDSVLNELARAGLQSDARFAESYVRSQANRLGTARLCQTLRRKGVSGELVEAQVAALPDEQERVHAVWAKKYGTAPPIDSRERARQARFLQGRGFSVEIIRQLLKGIDAT